MELEMDLTKKIVIRNMGNSGDGWTCNACRRSAPPVVIDYSCPCGLPGSLSYTLTEHDRDEGITA